MASRDLAAVTEIVPQISYDILGRILPGTVVLLSLWIAVKGPGGAIADIDAALSGIDAAPGIWTVLLWIALAYVLAFVLNGIWQIPANTRRRRCPSLDPDLDHPSDSLKFEIINLMLPKAGSWFTKLDAEMNMTRVVALGWSATAVINAYRLVTITPFAWPRLWFELALVVGIAGVLAEGSSIYNTRTGSLRCLWLLWCRGELARIGIIQVPEEEESD